MELKTAATQEFNTRRSQDIKLPDFQSITKRIQEENVILGQMSLPFLHQYEENRKQFEKQGFNHTTTCLIKALCLELETICPPLKEIALMRSVSLFSTLLMMREYEIVLWSCFCNAAAVQQLVRENFSSEGLDVAAVKKLILNHLINTAYFTKRQVSSDEHFQQFQAFFDRNFQIFQGKHTDWLLLSEPDISEITPFSLNQRFQQLMKLFENKLLPEKESDVNSKVIDFNEVASKLVFESELMADLQLWKQHDKIKARQIKMEKKALKKRHRKGEEKDTQKCAAPINQEIIQLKPLIDIGIDMEKQLTSNPIPSQNHQVNPENVVSQMTPSKKREQPFASDFMTKTVSNMIIQQMAPVQLKQKVPISNATESERNLNDSLMWQTMQSRIFDMNTIMRSLNDGGDFNQNLKHSNLGIPMMSTAYDGVIYNNAGFGSQVGGVGQTLFGQNNKGSSSILQIYNQNHVQPQQYHYGGLVPNQPGAQQGPLQNASLLQTNSLLYQGQPSMSFFLGASNSGAPAQINFGANPMHQSSLLGGLAGKSTPSGLHSINPNIASFVRTHSQLQHNTSLQSVAHLLQQHNQQLQGYSGQPFFQYSPRHAQAVAGPSQPTPGLSQATGPQEYGAATPQPKQQYNPNSMMSPLDPIRPAGNANERNANPGNKSPQSGSLPPQNKRLFFPISGGSNGPHLNPVSSNQITSAPMIKKPASGSDQSNAHQDTFQYPENKKPSQSAPTLAKLRNQIRDDGKMFSQQQNATAENECASIVSNKCPGEQSNANK